MLKLIVNCPSEVRSLSTYLWFMNVLLNVSSYWVKMNTQIEYKWSGMRIFCDDGSTNVKLAWFEARR